MKNLLDAHNEYTSAIRKFDNELDAHVDQSLLYMGVEALLLELYIMTDNRVLLMKTYRKVLGGDIMNSKNRVEKYLADWSKKGYI